MHIGLIGAGRIGSFHAQSLKANRRVSRLTITDADVERAVRLAENVGAQHADDSYALLRAGIDALVIAAATPAHAELLHLAADASLPTFCEKPIALDLGATDAVIEQVERSRTYIQIGFQRRFDPGYRAAKEAIDSGVVGDIHLLRMATHDPAPPSETYIGQSGGIWLDLAVHDFDIASWMVGSPVVEVYADGRASDTMFERYHDVDAACAVLRFQNGPLGVMTAARNDPRGYDVRMEIFGLRDTVAVGVDGRTALRSMEPGIEAPPAHGYADFLERFQIAYRLELEAFLAAISTGAPSPCTIYEARHALVVALAADRSRREHRPVRMEEIA